ncbi:hypothetical protein CRPA15_25840 [Pseudomonas aeruginosa]|nr:hypothetical protein VNPA152080_48920 [Pseudomonas aeruginosa]
MGNLQAAPHGAGAIWAIRSAGAVADKARVENRGRYVSKTQRRPPRRAPDAIFLWRVDTSAKHVAVVPL